MSDKTFSPNDLHEIGVSFTARGHDYRAIAQTHATIPVTVNTRATGMTFDDGRESLDTPFDPNVILKIMLAMLPGMAQTFVATMMAADEYGSEQEKSTRAGEMLSAIFGLGLGGPDES